MCSLVGEFRQPKLKTPVNQLLTRAFLERQGTPTVN